MTMSGLGLVRDHLFGCVVCVMERLGNSVRRVRFARSLPLLTIGLVYPRVLSARPVSPNAHAFGSVEEGPYRALS